MSKPVFMCLHNNGTEIAVNMSQVAYITPNDAENTHEKCVLYFATWCPNEAFGGEPLYLVVDEPIDEIASRREWHQ